MKELLLISRAVRGDRDALEQLVRLYYEKIYNYIFLRVCDRTLAEDLTQDVFVKLTKIFIPTFPRHPFQRICTESPTIGWWTIIGRLSQVKKSRKPRPHWMNLLPWMRSWMCTQYSPLCRQNNGSASSCITCRS